MSMANPISAPPGRRSHARYKMDSLAYVDFDPDNGAILVDLGEGGLGFQSFLPVSSNHALRIKLKLPRGSIEGYAEVTWLDESGKGGGLRFVDLSSEARAQIRDWTSAVAASQACVAVPPAQSAGGSDSAQQRVTEHSAVAPARESAASQSIMGGEPTAQDFQAFVESENAQEAVSPEISDELRADEAAPEQMPADQVLADLEALPIPGFIRGPAEVAADSIPPLPASTSPERAVQIPASDFKNSLPIRKRKASPDRFKPESPGPGAFARDTSRPRSFIRQSQRSASANPQWDNLPDRQERDSKSETTPSSQALKVGIGAAAGALLVLALVALVPFLRTRLQATANPESAGSNLPNAQVFEVEVADLSNRRWILRSGGEAVSPFTDVPFRRETLAAGGSASRIESTKVLRPTDSESDEAQTKSFTPSELGILRPHAPQAAAAPAQVLAPSIFDGITPPIGSVSDSLEAKGPDPPRPGIVQPQSQVGARTSGLQAAVLVQRVEPVYPKIAVALRVKGHVRLSATIGRDGVPRDIKVITGDQRLVEAARTAISQWRYRPATRGGEPVETQTLVNIDFELH
jgi:TonB family protein